MSKSVRQIRNEYAQFMYVYYAYHFRVNNINDFPEYIEEEAHLDFGIPYIKKLISSRMLQVNGDGSISPTPSGRRLLDRSSDYRYFFEKACPYISVEEFVLAKQSSRGASRDDVILRIFSDKLEMAFKTGRFQQTRDLLIDSAVMLKDNNPERALKCCLRALLISASGIEYAGMIDEYESKVIKYKDLLARFSDYFYVDIRLPGLIRELIGRVRADMPRVVYSEFGDRFSLCSEELFEEIINDIEKGTYSDARWQSRLTDVFTGRFVDSDGSGKDYDKEIENDMLAGAFDVDVDSEYEDDV